MKRTYSPPPLKIELPFNRESVLQVLDWGIHPNSAPFSHKDIVEWCERFWTQYIDIEAPSDIAQLLPILESIDAQWELYLSNTYSFEELRVCNLEKVQLPIDWFKKWLLQSTA